MMKKEISFPKAAAITLAGGQRHGESATQASRRGWKRGGAAALALTVALGAGAAVKDKPKAPADTGNYVFQPGETTWGVAKKVEANIDGVAGNQDVRPIADDIYEQVTNDSDKRVLPGDVAQLPTAADVDPNVPGIQLDK